MSSEIVISRRVERYDPNPLSRYRGEYYPLLYYLLPFIKEVSSIVKGNIRPYTGFEDWDRVSSEIAISEDAHSQCHN